MILALASALESNRPLDTFSSALRPQVLILGAAQRSRSASSIACSNPEKHGVSSTGQARLNVRLSISCSKRDKWSPATIHSCSMPL